MYLRMSLTGSKYQKEYLIVNHMTAIRSQHDEYSMRFAASMNQVSYHPLIQLSTESHAYHTVFLVEVLKHIKII